MIELASTNFCFYISNSRFRVIYLGLLVTALCQLSMAAVSDPLRYQSGLRNSSGERRLSSKHLAMLVENLRQKTGFLEMHFDETGFLSLGDRLKIAGGSAVARELLIAAVDRMRVIELEFHDHSAQVAFARLAKPIAYISHSTGARIEAFPIEIDFSDFNHLRGDKAVLAAFDLGFVVLHELAHAALGLHDSSSETAGPGECEEYINRIRGELGLPERQNYVARTFINKAFPVGRSSRHAELFFALKTEQQGRGKTQTLNLTWEAERVGMIKEIEIKPSSVASKTQAPAVKSQTVAAP
jgi:hypothetical protein